MYVYLLGTCVYIIYLQVHVDALSFMTLFVQCNVFSTSYITHTISIHQLIHGTFSGSIVVC